MTHALGHLASTCSSTVFQRRVQDRWALTYVSPGIILEPQIVSALPHLGDREPPGALVGRVDQYVGFLRPEASV